MIVGGESGVQPGAGRAALDSRLGEREFVGAATVPADGVSVLDAGATILDSPYRHRPWRDQVHRLTVR